jgi:LmeA-like phospholipid-binding
MHPGEPQHGGAHWPPPAPNPPQQPGYPLNPQDQAPAPPTEQLPSRETSPPVKTKRRFLRDPVSIVLVFVIVVSLVVAALIGAELYARHVANDKVTKAVECEAKDSATVSFGPMPPFLWQHINGDYTNISIQTAGNQIRSAKGMKADIEIRDVNLHGNADSKGTIGALDATLTWSSDGIKQTVQDAIPIIGSMITSSVTTNPSDGTVQLKGTLDNVTVKPQVVGNGLSLQVVSFTGMGFMLPRESVQSTLDAFTSNMTKQFPLGIHADSVQVTDQAVVGHFSTRDASIPSAQSNPCFADL